MSNRDRSSACAGLIVAGLLIATGEAAAQIPAADTGRAVAAARCAVCHSIDGAGDSPHRASPPFRTLAEDFPSVMLENALRTGVISGHDEMPMFELAPADMNALLTYIDSLAPPDKRYLGPAR